MPDFEVSWAFDFKCDHALGLAEFWVGVDEDGHDVSVDDVGEHVAIGDDLELVPLAGFDEGFHLVGGSEQGQQCWLLVGLGGYDLAAPGDDATVTVLLVELAGVAIVVVKIGLVALQVPLGMLKSMGSG